MDKNYKNEFKKAHYDRIELALPKGKKEAIKKAADSVSESLTTFVANAIDERLCRIKEGR